MPTKIGLNVFVWIYIFFSFASPASQERTSSPNTVATAHAEAISASSDQHNNTLFETTVSTTKLPLLSTFSLEKLIAKITPTFQTIPTSESIDILPVNHVPTDQIFSAITTTTKSINISTSTFDCSNNESIFNRTSANATSSDHFITTVVPTSTTTLTTIMIKREEDYHKYYKSVVTKGHLSAWWVREEVMYKADKHHTLSESYRSAATVSLSFPFSFYGHLVSQVTIATGGFLYMSEFLHQWLTATQYIAPLMANFDTQIGNNSHIRYLDDGKMFVVWWENIHLQDDSTGRYSFQAQLHRNGTIIFCYKELPFRSAMAISSHRHPVKVGLSDAYYMDKPTNTDMKQRTIYEYHRVEINMSLIAVNTTVVITPLPSCVQMSTCSGCIGARMAQACQWCSSLQYCSDGMDRKRQEWLHYGCNKQFISRREQCERLGSWHHSVVSRLANTNVVIFLLVMTLLTLLLSCVAAWLVYAYKHPSSRSGIWLIEHHPAHLKVRLQSTFSRIGKSLNNSSKYRVAMQPEVESLAQM